MAKTQPGPDGFDQIQPGPGRSNHVRTDPVKVRTCPNMAELRPDIIQPLPGLVRTCPDLAGFCPDLVRTKSGHGSAKVAFSQKKDIQ